jgi:hypothetical protein
LCGDHPSLGRIERGLGCVEVRLGEAVGGKQRPRSFEIEPSLGQPGLSFSKFGASLVDSLPVVGIVNARQDGSLVHEIAGLRSP